MLAKPGSQLQVKRHLRDPHVRRDKHKGAVEHVEFAILQENDALQLFLLLPWFAIIEGDFIEAVHDLSGGAGRHPVQELPSNSLTISTTRSGSKPNFFCSSLSGADDPNVFMPIMRPAGPT